MTNDVDGKQEEGIHHGAYRSFLVRCWQEPDAGNGCPAWRFTLVPLDEEQPQRGFASLEDLMACLRNELAETLGTEDQYRAE